MTQSLKMTIALTAACLSFNATKAQFDKEKLSLGGGIGMYGYTQDVGKAFVINLRGNYNLTDKSSAVVSFNFHLPMSQSTIVTADALSSTTFPNQVPVSKTNSISLYNICLNYHRYFI